MAPALESTHSVAAPEVLEPAPRVVDLAAQVHAQSVHREVAVPRILPLGELDRWGALEGQRCMLGTDVARVVLGATQHGSVVSLDVELRRGKPRPTILELGPEPRTMASSQAGVWQVAVPPFPLRVP